MFCRCQDPRSVARPKPPSDTGALPVPGSQVGGRPKAALGHWCSAGARMPGRWPTQSRPRPLVFCRCQDPRSVADPKPPRPLASCRCHDIISVADPKSPSAIGVLPVPGSQVGDRPKSALGHWCFASATISSRWPTQIRPRPLVFCQRHDMISVADPNPPSATGGLLVPRYILGGRPKSALGHWCFGGATISSRRPTQIRPWQLVFCRCHNIILVADPNPPSATDVLLMPRSQRDFGADPFQGPIRGRFSFGTHERWEEIQCPGAPPTTEPNKGDTRLREAGVEAVYCLARGAPKGPNIPRAQLNHQGPLFPGHGYATHSQTWVGEPTWLGVRSDATHQAPTKVGAPCVRVWWPTWLGSVVTLLTKHLAPKVQAPPAGLGDFRLQEAGAKVVCCHARGAPKGPNLPRAQLKHQDALFPGHGLATHSQTWVGLSHFFSGSVVSPKWLGSVVTLLIKHLAPKVQAPPAELGVRGDATLQTPVFRGAPCGAVFP
ncbi:hypothetical protein ISCGN_006973 [Ixodes scapularis]